MELKKLFFSLFIGLFLINFINASSLTNQLKYHYKFDETSGDIAIDSVQGKNGTIHNAFIGINGKLNYSYDFNGSGYVSIKNNLSQFDSGTMAVWFKVYKYPDPGDANYIAGESYSGYDYGDWFWYINGSGYIFWMVENLTTQKAAISNFPLNINKWYYIVVEYGSNGIKLYINGTLQSTNNITNKIVGSNWTIGANNRNDDIESILNGSLDEFSFWNRTLSDSEVLLLYNNGEGIFYPFDAGFISLNFPPNNYKSLENEIIDYNCSIKDLNNLKNISLWIDNGSDFYIQDTKNISGNKNETIFSDYSLSLDYNWTCQICNSSGHCQFAIENRSIIILPFLINYQSYNPISFETSNETYLINLNYSSSKWLDISANLIYDGESYEGIKSGTGNNVIFYKTLNIPIINSTLNKTFYWEIKLTNLSGTYFYNSSFNNQTVNPIILSICNATINIPIINFTIMEEGTFDLLNASLESIFKYWISGNGEIYKTYSYSRLDDNQTNYAFCIYPADFSIITDATISYLKNGYDRREYLLDNANLDNQTENINLYLASTESTDIFTFTVRDENDNVIPGATIRIQRWNIGNNNFYTVGMVYTSNDGTGIINMRLNDAWYRYQVLYDGKLYLTTDPIKESGTSRTLEINLASANPYNQFENIDYSLTYNNQTNITVFTYADTTGSIKTGCLKILKMTGFENEETYYSCVESTSGTLSYYINDSGTYAIRAIIKLNENYNNVEKIVEEIVRQGVEEKFKIFGKFGSVISLLVIGTSAMIGIAIGSIILGLGLIIISLILLNLIGWLNITATVLYGLISIVILIALNLRRKNG